ncbi:MAG: helix-turn-helix domain-containing protein [Treponema sp.]|jgi:transcriptional regulator with XRE-family HTH domain|nr:helix-turn-helix domain-containing protein [Treponema sp.]
MTGIREVLAANIRENRRRLGLTQEQFAEKANVSTHYIALIETCNKYPKPEMVERLAGALGVEPLQLFSATTASNGALERLIRQGMTDMKQVVREAVKEAFADECKGRGGN